jgi:hypothetical protein
MTPRRSREEEKESLKMKTLVMLGTGMILAAGLAMAEPPAKKPAAKPPATASSKTHDVSAEFVSLDAKASKITIKDEAGKEQSFKAGDKLTLTCRDDAKGMHQAVTHVKARKA